MSSHPRLYALLRYMSVVTAIASAGALHAYAQEPQPPAFLTVTAGEATLERAGESEPATANMPFVAGDRLHTGAGRVEIAFPDGTAIEVGEYSEVEAISPTRVRLIAGTMDHIQRVVASSQSATYLPPDLQTFGSTFDQYGSWQYDQPYGYVWYPQVGPDWRPYSYGSWSPIRSYGWTWVGAEAWAWPTHHYGRWGFARNAWFWIPGRTWGAAWVSWSFADDYVSWCPLGWNSRPVFALSIGSRRGWDDWTVPRRTFETRAYRRNYAGDFRGGSRGAWAGRESVNGNRSGRSTPSERVNLARGSAADFRRPSPRGVNVPAAPGGAIAVPRVGAGDAFGNRDAGLGIRRPSTPYTRSSVTAPPQTSIPAAAGGVIAVPRVGARESSGNRDSGFAGRDSGFGIRNRPLMSDARPTLDARPTPHSRPTPDARPPTADSGRQEAPAAPATPHERAAPAAGEARGQAQARRR